MADTDTRPGWQRLRDWRKAQEISQHDAAERLGVRQATWCEWESADVKRGPNRDMAIRIEALTEGAVPIESWSQDPRVAEDMERVIRNRTEHDDAAETVAPPSQPEAG